MATATISQEKEVKEVIGLDGWMRDYQENTGRFWNILRQRIRIARYSLEYESELDDLMQSSLCKVFEIFSRKGSIPRRYINTTFKLCARNALTEYVRSIKKFRCQPVNSFQYDVGFNSSGEKVAVTSSDYNAVDLRLDLARILTRQEYKAVELLDLYVKKKMTMREVEKAVKLSPGQLWRLRKKIAKKIDAAGLREVF